MKPMSANQELLKKRPLFFSIGLVIALSAVITAFEWRTGEIIPNVDFQEPGTKVIDVDDIIVTVHTVPPKPKPAVIKEVVNDEPIELTDVKDLLSPEDFTEPTESYGLDDLPALKDEDAPEFVDYSVSAPSFIGGEVKFYEYLRKNLEYPASAKVNGTMGLVVLSFVINEEGSITNIKVVKGVNEELNNAAIEVLKNSPKWKPGLKAGIPFKTRMQIPIQYSFELK